MGPEMAGNNQMTTAAAPLVDLRGSLSPKEAAARLRCGVDWVQSEIRRRRLAPVTRLNARVILIPPQTLQAYVAQRTN